MATEERQHGTMLQKRYFDRYGTRPCSVTEEDIRDFIEVPHLENGDIFTISKLKVGRSPREMALEIAIAAEQGAVRYYTRLNLWISKATTPIGYRRRWPLREGRRAVPSWLKRPLIRRVRKI